MPKILKEHNGNKQKKHIIYRIAAIILILIAIAACLLACGTVYAKRMVKEKAEEVVAMVQPVDKEIIETMENENLDEETLEKLKDNWTVAVFGIDSREENGIESGNSDVIMLAVLDHDTGGVKIVSVYRDTCLRTGKDSYQKANSAYASGGPKEAVRMLNENLDLRIDDYVAFNWKSVAEAINILGGIDLEITKKEFRYINAFITETVNSTQIPSVQLKEPGMQHLDGVQAVAYARLRLMDNDFKRTERQRKVVELALQKAKQADIDTLLLLVNTIFPEIASSVSTDDLDILIKNILKLNIEETSGFPFTHFEKTVGGAAYVFPDDLKENVSELHRFLYGTEDYKPSDNVATISDAVKEKAGR